MLYSMGAASKRARKIRDASEFDPRALSTAMRIPKGGGVSLTSWTLDAIFAARDDQMRGHFLRPARLAESMRTDDAIKTAYETRLAPQRCIKVELKAAKGARGASIAAEADALFGQDGVGVTAATRASIHDCLVTHDVAFAQVTAVPREDGSRVDLFLSYWPIEFVRWDANRDCYVTSVDPEGGEFEVEIRHGEGRWVVFERFERHSFKHGTLLAAALIWARHAYAIRDWAKGSVAHGAAKVLGELPQGVALQDADGNLTAEASALVELLQAVATSDSPVGIKPAGSTVDFMVNGSTAWQVWSELVTNAEKAAARLYLGTDGTLGSQGGAPGVDVQALFGVAATRVEGDLSAISRGLQTGIIEVWCALNFGDSSLAPRHRYMLPDGDADAARASLAARTDAFYTEIARARETGFAITQEFVNAVADKHGVDAPMLPVESAKAPSIALAPTDIARVVSVNEARASAGLGPLTDVLGALDPDGRLTVEAYAAKQAAKAAPSNAPAGPPIQ